ncbi:MAG TPA: hypothetical protein VNM89_02340 [Solirubrobacterales bacterium]|nr:hypothetical protein [Solirubrobacterales bacterium]
MADGERRMVFDTSGRRKRVVQVVYGLLALIMAASLLLVVGPFSVGDLFSQQDAAESAADALDDQAAAIERKLRRNPNDEALLLALTRTRISAGNSLSEIDPATGQATVTPEARQEYLQAADAWDRYLRAAEEPSPSGAQLAATALFSLAQTATTGAEVEADVRAAAEAQQIVADSRPNLGTVSTLAIYDYYAFKFAEGDKVAKQAAALATSRAQRKSVESQLADIRRQAKRFQRQQALLARFNRGQGKEQLQNPLGGLSGATP